MRIRRPPPLLLLGIIGVLLVAAFSYFAFAQRLPFVTGYRVKAEFPSSNQLVVGFSPVRIAGVTVGEVVGVERGPGDTTLVEMELEDVARPLASDATARIRPRLFLEGGFAVELTTGSPTAPELPDGGTLPIGQTALPVQFDQINSVFGLSVRESLQLMVRELDTAFADGGAEALGQAFRPLTPAFRDTAIVAEALRGRRPNDLSRGIAATSQITAALASRDAELRELVTNLARTTTALAERDVELVETVRATDRLVREAPGSLDRIDESLPSITRFVAALRPGLRQLPGSLTRTVPVLDQLDALSRPGELPGLVRDATPVVERVPLLQDRLITLFDLVTPVSQCVTRNFVPTLLADIPDGRLSTNRPVWQELASALVGLSSASSTFDGNGHAIRFLGGLGLFSISSGVVPGLEEIVRETLGGLLPGGQLPIVGDVPGVGDLPVLGDVLQGLASEPVTGANPRWLGPGVAPPYRPDVPCAQSDPPDLTQRTGAGTVSTSRALTGPERRQLTDSTAASRSELRDALDEAQEVLTP